jgi:hypothetical protein
VGRYEIRLTARAFKSSSVVSAGSAHYLLASGGLVKKAWAALDQYAGG